VMYFHLKERSPKANLFFSANDGAPMGNLILSRFPFYTAHSYSHSSAADLKRKTIIGSFFHGKLIVCAAHITAYQNLHEKRARQMQEFVEYLNDNYRISEEECALSDNVIIMGDLNLHSTFENKFITDIGFVDFWESTEQDPDGYTWDTTKNGLIHILQMAHMDNRRMRLDRIIAKVGCKWTNLDDGGGEGNVHLFATEPVYPGSYLQCSDHFGLYTDVVFAENKHDK